MSLDDGKAGESLTVAFTLAGVESRGRTTDHKQVSYNGHPLSYFHGGHGLGAPDTKPGQTNGFGIYQVWYPVSPEGRPVKK